MHLRSELLPVFLVAMCLALPAPGASQANAGVVSQAGGAQSKEQTPRVYEVGGDVSAPRPLHMVEAEFTDKARRKKLTGTTRVELIVDEDGLPKDVHVTRSAAEGLPDKLRSAAIGLDENAVKAVKQYRFAPAMLQGRPVRVSVSVEVNFRIY